MKFKKIYLIVLLAMVVYVTFTQINFSLTSKDDESHLGADMGLPVEKIMATEMVLGNKQMDVLTETQKSVLPTDFEWTKTICNNPELLSKPDLPIDKYLIIIHACQNTIKEYPDTIEAKDAQLLLNKVPERYLILYDKVTGKKQINKSRPLRSKMAGHFSRSIPLIIER